MATKAYRVARTQKLVIQGRLENLNDYQRTCRAGKRRYQPGNDMKKNVERYVYYSIKQCKLKPFCGPIRTTYMYYEPDKRRDWDNINAFAMKCILDALQRADILVNDNWNYLHEGFCCKFAVDKTNPRIEVLFEEMEEVESGADED